MMEYIEMTIEEALKYNNGDKSKMVLVAIQDLENNDDIIEFKRHNKAECENIIKKAETIAREYDEFVNQLKVFTKRQLDLKNIQPYGKLTTILYRSY